MNKEALVELIGKDLKASSEISESLDRDLENLKDQDVDSFIERHFDELKSLPITGAKIRGYKPGQAEDEKLASDFGYGSIDDLFKLGSKKHWTRYRKETLERLAKENGMTYDDFRSRLVNAQKAYNEVQLKKERQRIWEEGMNPKFKEHPIDWVGMKLAKMFMGNALPDFKEAVLEGKDVDNAKLARDLAIDTGFLGLNFLVPGGKYVSKAPLLRDMGGLGRMAGGAAYNGGLAAANEGSQAYFHDKDFDIESVMLAAALGGAFDIQGKQVGDMVKSFGNGSKTARKIGNDIEYAMGDFKGSADDYVKEMKSLDNIYQNPRNNPASNEYKITPENVHNPAVSREEAEKAREAMDLFEHVNKRTRPEILDKEQPEVLLFDGFGEPPKISNKRPMNDHEYYNALSKHQPLLNLEKSITAGAKKVKNIKTVADVAKNSKVMHSVNKETQADIEKTRKIAMDNKERQWANGVNLPQSASDPDWKEYQEWALKNPKLAEDGRIASLFNR